MAATKQADQAVQVETKVPQVEAQAPQVDPNQKVETDAYVPTYKVRPEFKTAVLKAIGKYPFNQIASIMNAINVEVMDHNTLTQVINVLGNFPYQDVAPLLSTVNDYVEQIVED
jgi:hypothetical protein